MGAKLISFRLQNDAIEAIQALQKDNESLALAAQRVLTDALGLSAKGEVATTPRKDSLEQKLVDSIINNPELLEMLRKALNQKTESTLQPNLQTDVEDEPAISAQSNVVPTKVMTTSPSVGSETEFDVGQDIPADAVGVLLEDQNTLTSDQDADLIAKKFFGTDEALDADKPEPDAAALQANVEEPVSPPLPALSTTAPEPEVIAPMVQLTLAITAPQKKERKKRAAGNAKTPRLTAH